MSARSSRKKLFLNRETIRDLRDDQLRGAAGGLIPQRAESGICSASGVCVCDTNKSCTTGSTDFIGR